MIIDIFVWRLNDKTVLSADTFLKNYGWNWKIPRLSTWKLSEVKIDSRIFRTSITTFVSPFANFDVSNFPGRILNFLQIFSVNSFFKLSICSSRGQIRSRGGVRFYGREISRANKERLLIVTFPVDDDPANILISRVIFSFVLFNLKSIIVVL